ncbi:class I adenylate-forming enzyme family protein [Streptomyces klenkii]|uniref:class I adenylate-forming enzyme family protein n=1 Tax=Streptomyces klenkii TaxID=1420899 RepID=UPI0033C3C38F
MAIIGSPSWWGEGLLERQHDDDVWTLADRAVVYGELREHVGFLASRMAAEGIGRGSSVALRMPPSLTLMYTMLAAWTRGAQVMLIDVRLTAFEVDRLLRICGPQFLLSAQPASPVTRYLVEDVPFTLMRRATGRPAVPEFCLVQASSGSTGEPKVIGRSSDSLLAELERYAALEGMPRAGERVLLLNSIIHTMGLVGGVLHGLNSGAQIVFPSRMRAETIVETALTTESNAILGVPVHFALLARSALGAVPSLRLAVSAGELLPLKTWTQFRQRYRLPISPVYGTTETGIIAADLITGSEPPILGRPTAGMEVDVVAGELRVRMECTPYLWSDRADRFHDGWLRTFDRCDRDLVNGVLTYRGRADSVVAIGGLKVDLMEVEQTLLLHPHVQEAVVVFGDVIEAYVGGDTAVTAADITNWCRFHLADFKIPKIFRIFEEVPRNANGKVIRNRDLLRRQEETGAHTHH